MIRSIPPLIVLGLIGAGSACAGPTADDFTAPVRLEAGGDFIKVDAPGYAAPSWVDIDADGHGDLVVGQFANGWMKLHRGTDAGFETGQWIMADGKAAEVPGVW